MERTVNVVEQITEAEARFERWRRVAGFVLAPAVFLTLLLLPLPGLKPEAHRLAALMAAVVVMWVTEALPLKETSADVSIAGVIAHVKVHQLFENTGRNPIEAVSMKRR